MGRVGDNESRSADAALAASEERLRRILGSTSDGVLMHEPDGLINYANPRLAQLLGYEPHELAGRSLTVLMAPERHARLPSIMEARMRGESLELDAEYIRKDGSRLWAHVRAEPLKDEHGRVIGGLATFKDLSVEKAAHERVKRLEDQLTAAQKLEAIGRLAGGIAHDFNNILTVILSNAVIALELLPAGSAPAEMISDIHKAGGKAADLTRQLLAFGRKQVLQPKPVHLSQLVHELGPLLTRLMREDIELTVLAPAELPLVMADPSQMEQVVINLCVNGRDAMPRGGKLTIELSSIDLDSDFAAIHLGTRPGLHVQLSVSDTGVGMTKEVQQRIFEPFFSTKGEGGTGLGLSTVHGIVTQSGGTIWVYSEPGAGSAFKLYLPVTDAPVSVRAASPVSAPAGGGETILVVEDDAQVRKLVLSVLRRAGYDVLEAAGPADALRVSEQLDKAVHLLLTDVVMPGMSGGRLAEQLKGKRADLKVLFMSGYTDDAIVQHGVLDGTADFIEKPLTPAALLRRVRDVLDGRQKVAER